MDGWRGITLTVALGVVLGLATWIGEVRGVPSAEVNDAVAPVLLIAGLAALLGVPLIVGRWWVLAALAGPGVALLMMQWAGVAVRLDDTTGPALNYRTIYQLIGIGVVMAAMIGLRFWFDESRRSRPGVH